jgi:hypothetical protein
LALFLADVFQVVHAGVQILRQQHAQLLNMVRASEASLRLIPPAPARLKTVPFLGSENAGLCADLFIRLSQTRR